MAGSRTRSPQRLADDPFDCQRCGACCRNPDENRREGVFDWVEVAADEPLRARPQHARLLRRDPGGAVHLRLVDDGRCIALLGALGKWVRCSIYRLRPAGCRRVMPGDNRCRQYRAEIGL